MSTTTSADEGGPSAPAAPASSPADEVPEEGELDGSIEAAVDAVAALNVADAGAAAMEHDAAAPETDEPPPPTPRHTSSASRRPTSRHHGSRRQSRADETRTSHRTRPPLLGRASRRQNASAPAAEARDTKGPRSATVTALSDARRHAVAPLQSTEAHQPARGPLTLRDVRRRAVGPPQAGRAHQTASVPLTLRDVHRRAVAPRQHSRARTLRRARRQMCRRAAFWSSLAACFDWSKAFGSLSCRRWCSRSAAPVRMFDRVRDRTCAARAVAAEDAACTTSAAQTTACMWTCFSVLTVATPACC